MALDRNIGSALTGTSRGSLASTATVETISDLKSFTGPEDVVIVQGYNTAGDEGGGKFYWDAISTDTDDSGTVIQATGVATGRWKRIYTGKLNVIQFGATGNGTTDDTTAVQNMFNSVNYIHFPLGDYYLATEVICGGDNVSVTGAGRDKTKVKGHITIGDGTLTENWEVSGIWFYNSTRSTNRGLELNYTRSGRCWNCKFSTLQYGIAISQSLNDQFDHNIFNYVDVGIYQLDSSRCEDTYITHNTFRFDVQRSIQLWHMDGSTISHNFFFGGASDVSYVTLNHIFFYDQDGSTGTDFTSNHIISDNHFYRVGDDDNANSVWTGCIVIRDSYFINISIQDNHFNLSYQPIKIFGRTFTAGRDSRSVLIKGNHFEFDSSKQAGGSDQVSWCHAVQLKNVEGISKITDNTFTQIGGDDGGNWDVVNVENMQTTVVEDNLVLNGSDSPRDFVRVNTTTGPTVVKNNALFTPTNVVNRIAGTETICEYGNVTNFGRPHNPNLAIASAQFTVSGGAISGSNTYNCSVSRTGVGTYRLTFDKGPGNTTYKVFATADIPIDYTASTKTTALFDVDCGGTEAAEVFLMAVE